MQEALKAVLDKVTVGDNRYLTHEAFAEFRQLGPILPDGVRSQLAEWTSENPEQFFFRHSLVDRMNHREYIDNGVQLLSQLEGFSDTAELAAQMIAEIQSLPWEYHVFVRLPDSVGELMRESQLEWPVRLSNTLTLHFQSEETAHLALPAVEPPSTTLQLVSQMMGARATNRQSCLTNGDVYFAGHVHGYIPQFGSSATTEAFEDSLRAFLGFALAQNWITVNPYASAPLEEWHAEQVFRLSEDKWQPQQRQATNEQIARALNGISARSRIADFPATFVHRLVRNSLQATSTVLSAVENNRRLITAASWLFDSETTTDDMLAFVQAAVVLESLLGDKSTSKIIGVGELLASRCAYLIADSHSDRAKILEDIPDLYDIRSDIVHQGRRKLTRPESQNLFLLRWYCSRTIQKEMDLLVVDEKKRDASNK